MGSAVSVVMDTLLSVIPIAKLCLKLKKENEELRVSQLVNEAEEGPKSLDDENYPKTDLARFRQGFDWSESSFLHFDISPAARFTETAAPLPNPPLHLFQNFDIQNALQVYKNNLVVSTPFDVDKFCLFLSHHPNQPFVSSVIKGLQQGFWPFDQGD
jgi:hypothetical protein